MLPARAVLFLARSGFLIVVFAILKTMWCAAWASTSIACTQTFSERTKPKGKQKKERKTYAQSLTPLLRPLSGSTYLSTPTCCCCCLLLHLVSFSLHACMFLGPSTRRMVRYDSLIVLRVYLNFLKRFPHNGWGLYTPTKHCLQEKRDT